MDSDEKYKVARVFSFQSIVYVMEHPEPGHLSRFNGGVYQTKFRNMFTWL